MASDHCCSEECQASTRQTRSKEKPVHKGHFSQSLQKSVHLIFLLMGIADIIQIYTVCPCALFWIVKEDWTDLANEGANGSRKLSNLLRNILAAILIVPVVSALSLHSSVLAVISSFLFFYFDTFDALSVRVHIEISQKLAVPGIVWCSLYCISVAEQGRALPEWDVRCCFLKLQSLFCLTVECNIQGNLVLLCNLNLPLVFGEELVAYGTFAL